MKLNIVVISGAKVCTFTDMIVAQTEKNNAVFCEVC